MQHPIDESNEALTAALCAANPNCTGLAAACEMAAAVWDGNVTVPRGMRAAWVLTELKVDCSTRILAVLGDPRLRERIDFNQIADQFGHELAELTRQLHELNRFTENQIQLGNQAQIENLRRLIVSMVSDVRVLVVKLAYRLERLRALPYVIDFDERYRIADETLALYAPLAHRLGLGQLKWELEDLAFRHLEPDTYKQMAKLIEERREAREQYINQVKQRLTSALMEAGIKARIYGRPKHLYSIFTKMRRKQRGFDQLFDVRALRVHVDSVADCYAALSVVQTIWEPIPGEYDDYISNPKPNGYQSLHTAVRALEGKTLEVQIRTDEMHARAELGVAAHWRYKEGSRGGPDNFQATMERLRQALEEGEDTRVDLKHVYVFTPRGDVVELPAGSTPLDLAYRLHTELGHRCRGAKINDRLVPLNTPLKNADRVEILSGTISQPKRDWLDRNMGYLASRSAIQKVKAWFRARERESARETGQTIWEQTIRRLSLTREQQEQLLTLLNQRSREMLWEALGENRVTREALLQSARQLLRPEQTDLPIPANVKKHGADLSSFNLAGMLATPASCCHPNEQTGVVAFVTRSQGLRLHRPDCPNLKHLREKYPERVMEVQWPDNLKLPRRFDLELWMLPPTEDEMQADESNSQFLRNLAQVLGQFRSRLIASQSHWDRRSAQTRVRLTLEIPYDEKQEALLERLSQMRDVQEVKLRN